MHQRSASAEYVSWSDLRCVLANAERRDQLVDRQLSRRNRPEPESFAPTFPSLIGRHFNEQGVSYLQVLITPSGYGIRYRCIADEGLEARHVRCMARNRRKSRRGY